MFNRKPNPAVMAKHDEVVADVAVIVVGVVDSAVSEEKGVEGVGTEDSENEGEVAAVTVGDQGPEASETLTENQETTERESAFLFVHYVFCISTGIMRFL